MNICCSQAHELECTGCKGCEIKTLMQSIDKHKRQKAAWMIPNWEIDSYYERKLKKFDEE